MASDTASLQGFSNSGHGRSITTRRIFQEAVEAVTRVTQHLLDHMEAHAPPRTREAEIAKARVRAQKRYGRSASAG